MNLAPIKFAFLASILIFPTVHYFDSRNADDYLSAEYLKNELDRSLSLVDSQIIDGIRFDFLCIDDAVFVSKVSDVNPSIYPLTRAAGRVACSDYEGA